MFYNNILSLSIFIIQFYIRQRHYSLLPVDGDIGLLDIQLSTIVQLNQINMDYTNSISFILKSYLEPLR